MLDTRPLLLGKGFPEIKREPLEVLQVNLGYKCNLSCTHCHVNAGPSRHEQMSRENVNAVLKYICKNPVRTLDLTGGAPELNPSFKYLVVEARKLGVEVIDRCNLTILLESGFESLASFLADNKVVITASLPCYSEQNVEAQRGKGVYLDSISALKKLNSLGYGKDSDKKLNLVFNPDGINLPPEQSGLEKEYKSELHAQHGIVFNNLYTITNMPISRFGGMLLAKGLYDEYMSILKNSFQPENLATVMCRTLISVDYRGYVYDCDFNQMLGLHLLEHGDLRLHILDLVDRNVTGNQIKVGQHCFGCTAGQGSSCSGAMKN